MVSKGVIMFINIIFQLKYIDLKLQNLEDFHFKYQPKSLLIVQHKHLHLFKEVSYLNIHFQL